MMLHTGQYHKMNHKFNHNLNNNLNHKRNHVQSNKKHPLRRKKQLFFGIMFIK